MGTKSANAEGWKAAKKGKSDAVTLNRGRKKYIKTEISQSMPDIQKLRERDVEKGNRIQAHSYNAGVVARTPLRTSPLIDTTPRVPGAWFRNTAYFWPGLNGSCRQLRELRRRHQEQEKGAQQKQHSVVF